MTRRPGLDSTCKLNPRDALGGVGLICLLDLLNTRPHRPMRDTGIHEFVAFHGETGLFVKLYGGGLGVEKNFLISGGMRCVQQGLQNGTTNAATSPFLQYGHASDVAIGEQATTGHRLIGNMRQDVQGIRVQAVPFEFFGDVLLVDEHLAADHAEFACGFGPCDDPDRDWISLRHTDDLA